MLFGDGSMVQGSGFRAHKSLDNESKVVLVLVHDYRALGFQFGGSIPSR